jgi:hypothetical protein
METLDKNWLTQGLIDFEYKKYVLMAYLKNIRQNFSVNKLYPFLSDLIGHYDNLTKLQKDKIDLSNQFPKSLNLDDFVAQKLRFERLIKDDYISQELEDIMVYSIDKIRETMKTGKEIYEIVESNMDIIPVGLTSLYQDEGYMLLDGDKSKSLNIYRYQITVFSGPSEKYRAIHTTFLDQIRKSISTTYEQVRLMLIQRNKELDNPATFVIKSKQIYPMEETLLPIAKRLLVRYVNVA